MANKKLLALLLILVMLFSVSACKNKNVDPSASVDPSATATVKPTDKVQDLTSSVTPTPDRMPPVLADKEDDTNKDEDLVYADIFSQDFENATSVKDTGWSTFISGKIELSTEEGFEDSKCIKYYDATRENNRYTFSCPITNIFPNIKKPGAYNISFKIRLGGEDVDSVSGNGFQVLIRGGNANDANSFIRDNKSNYFYGVTAEVEGEVGEWMTVSFPLYVLASDLTGTHKWNLAFHKIDEYATEIYIDDLKIQYSEPKPETEKLITNAETWVATEMTFIANKTVEDAANKQLLDVEFTNGHQTYIMPGFWDGSNVWRVRFAFPAEGTWTYKTIFSDKTDTGVHNKTGAIEVKKYSGDLDIYKHGFVKTQPNTRYFVYNDGTPFFYLGDTHWSMLAEEYSNAGSKAGKIKTTSHFKYIVNKRVQQGFTVYQSEPIGASFDFVNGIDGGDITGLQAADKYFKYIADQGLVHANAQFFYSSTMNQNVMKNYTQAEYEKMLDTLSRYWIARFGAYPVMYTLAQEVDNDFYYKRDDNNTTMSASNNPWKFVCEALHKYDPYKNPISAHQESSRSYPHPKNSNTTSASNSAFRDVTGHTWWATQWKGVLTDKFDYTALMDYWVSGQGKPIVSYESNYEGLWTNNFGARAQGWLAFLNGMCGHGYGAVDIWYYNSNYDIDKDTVRDGITITIETKKTPWSTSVEYATGYELGYMRDFFEKYEWWKLTPAFNNKGIFTPDASHFSLASIGNDLFIAYIFDGIANEGTTKTGTIKALDANAEYTYQWFNPRTSAMSEPQKANKNGTEFKIGERPTTEDWVLVVQKVK